METETKYETISEPMYRMFLMANALIHAYQVYGTITENQLAEYIRLRDDYETWHRKLYEHREEGV